MEYKLQKFQFKVKKIKKNRTNEFKNIYNNKDIENFCPGGQGPGEMQPHTHTQKKKKIRVLRVIGIPEWCKHMHAQKFSFINIRWKVCIYDTKSYLMPETMDY